MVERTMRQEKKEVKKTRKSNRRPLTRTEIILLTLLGALLLFFAFYKYVFQPQADKMEVLNQEIYEYESKISENNRVLRNEEKILAEREELQEERDKIVDRYFPIIDQSQIIYLLNDLLLEKDVDVSDFQFSRPAIETMGRREVAKMDISLPFEGKFSDILEVLEAVQKSQRRILFSSLDFNRGESNILTGNLSLNVLSLEGMVDADGDVIHVETINRDNGNPFIPYEDYKEPQSNSGGSGTINNGSSPGQNQGGSNNSNPSPVPGGPSSGDTADPDKNNSGEKELGQESSPFPFRDRDYNFVTASESIVTSFTTNNNKDRKSVELFMDYSIGKSSQEQMGYIDLSDEKIIVRDSMDCLSINLASLKDFKGEIGFLLEDQARKDLFLPFTKKFEGSNWIENKIDFANSNYTYPLYLKGVYLKIGKDTESSGVLALDGLELSSNYILYKVKKGDSIYSISIKMYGSDKYMHDILELNNMKINDILYVGRKLKLKKYS